MPMQKAGQLAAVCLWILLKEWYAAHKPTTPSVP